MMQDMDPRKAIVLVMGATGTGKSTFINLLYTNDPVGDTETVDIQESIYKDESTGAFVTLVDTPGFQDALLGISSTDVLQKIVQFSEHDGEKMLNGIIYMHSMCDFPVGRVSRKNIDILRQICGENKLSNVRIVTTNWDHVNEEEGNKYEAALRADLFKVLIDAGAHLIRQDQGLKSARLIISDLVYKEPAMMQIQEELRDGRTLGATSAGAIVNQELTEIIEEHLTGLASLKIEKEELEKKTEELKELKEQWEAQKEKLEGMEELEKEMVERMKRVEEMVEMVEKMEKRDKELKKQKGRLEVSRGWEKLGELQKQMAASEQKNKRIEKLSEEAVMIRDKSMKQLEAEQALVLQDIQRLRRNQDKLNSVTLALFGSSSLTADTSVNS